MMHLYFVPRYYEEIKEPMDFGTMSTKLDENKYTTMEEFGRDVELIFANCRQFNPPTTYPVQCADTLERIWKKEWSKAMEKKLSYQEKRGLQGMLKQIVGEQVYVHLFFQHIPEE